MKAFNIVFLSLAALFCTNTALAEDKGGLFV